MSLFSRNKFNRDHNKLREAWGLPSSQVKHRSRVTVVLNWILRDISSILPRFPERNHQLTSAESNLQRINHWRDTHLPRYQRGELGNLGPEPVSRGLWHRK